MKCLNVFLKLLLNSLTETTINLSPNDILTDILLNDIKHVSLYDMLDQWFDRWFHIGS